MTADSAYAIVQSHRATTSAATKSLSRLKTDYGLNRAARQINDSGPAKDDGKRPGYLGQCGGDDRRQQTKMVGSPSQSIIGPRTTNTAALYRRPRNSRAASGCRGRLVPDRVWRMFVVHEANEMIQIEARKQAAIDALEALSNELMRTWDLTESAQVDAMIEQEIENAIH